MPNIPLPPLSYRELVGPTEDRFFDNPTGGVVFPALPPAPYDFVLDFGCGCGRIARQLIQQEPRPKRYVGIDLHAGMIQWCRENLAPIAPGFEFQHHDVYNPGFNPQSTARHLPFPVPDRCVSLALAWSVFTHINEAQTLFYLGEMARVLRPDGIVLSTWFLFDKSDFPMMQEFQNALFINETDPTNAVIFDRDWVKSSIKNAGLRILRIMPPEIFGYQWQLWLTPDRPGLSEARFPTDAAPKGRLAPPLGSPKAAAAKSSADLEP
ncbi:MAG TPA: class I SAM-dependent methyltransferase [Thermoanaerobaculia bacterium]|nr:class I SAM-dependent methyltransferase [Thermoanaerobaculia bacterium]